MRWRFIFGLAAAALVLTAASGASAQPGDPRFYEGSSGRNSYSRQAPSRDVYGRPAPPGYYPGMLIQRAPQQTAPQPGFSLRRLFGMEDEPPPVLPTRPRQAPVLRSDRPRPAPPPATVRNVAPKVDPSTHVVVFGDAFAELTGQGLDDIFEEAPDVAVVRKVRGEGSLIRTDIVDWPKWIQETLNGGQITVAVVMLGANDRQPIRDGDVSHEPLSDQWRTIYRTRVEAVMRVFQERGIPVVWIGAPPMRSERLSADLVSINEILRDSVQRFGGSYVDIWPGFVNDENRYTSTGPDVNGQPSRLRANDGVLFTRAGARKAAHFADAEIKRIIEAKRTGTAVAAVPAPGAPPEGASVEQILGALPALPELPGTPPLQAKPLVGPVLPLTRPDLAPGGTLLTGAPRLDGDQSYTARRALRDGVAPAPRPGRADDFRWPPI